MADNIFLYALRKEDFLNLIFELVNLDTVGSPIQLVRKNAQESALLIVHFPPQHIAEEAFPGSNSLGNLPPIQAMLGGPSRLVFKLPDDEDTWPLTLETLMNWKNYIPVVADNTLPPNGTTDPELNREKTSIEIPTGLHFSPDEFGVWTHSIIPVEQDGRFELWHTKLGTRESDSNGTIREGGTTRVIWASNPNIPFNSSLTQEDRNSIAHLTSDFTLPEFPKWIAEYPGGDAEDLWHMYLTDAGLPLKYTPSPVYIRRLMLSSAGAWAKLEGAWDYPTITDETSNLGYPKFNLNQWQHIISQGRDQYVKTVKKAFLCDTGHRASIVTITERQFHPYWIRNQATSGGEVSIYGAQAVLRQQSYITVEEPVKNYENLTKAYISAGREMPFKQIHITTTSTPFIDEHPQGELFWPMLDKKPFLFQIVAEDWEGKIVTFERPLACVPLEEGQTDWNDLVNKKYNANHLEWRTVPIHFQSIAFAETTDNSQGKTTLKTDHVVFEAQLVNGDKINELLKMHPGHPLFLPTVKEAKVSLPSVEQLLGRPFIAEINFDQDYLQNGYDQTYNKGEVFARLKTKLDLPFPAEKAGGLIKPASSIEGLSRSLGPVANLSNMKMGKFDINVFENAKFLGGITLKEILQEVNFEPTDIQAADIPMDELQDKLNYSTFYIKVPMLTNRTLYAGGKVIGTETRFLWKPVIQDYVSPFFQFLTQKGKESESNKTGFQNDDAQLAITARLVTDFNGKSSIYEVRGQLKYFALNFVDAMKLKFKSFSFSAESNKKMDVTAEGLDLEFLGPLKFVNTLKNIIPASGFSDPPFLNVTASGISAGYTLGVPTVGVGVFSLQNINLTAALSLPFVDQPAGIRFAISERHKPFLVTVGLFGGGGFFALALNAKGIEEIEAAIEFGGNICLDLGVASGGVAVMAGIYFGMTGNNVKLTGYLRCGGYLSVLGIISISVEFYLGFTYHEKDNGGGEVRGRASVTVGIKIAFFSKSVNLTIERKFAGAAGDPTFKEMVSPCDWEEYCSAFA